MNAKKKNLRFRPIAILLMASVIALFAASAFGYDVGDFSYSYSLSTKEATLTGYSGSSSQVTIPSSFTVAETYKDDDGETHTRHHTIRVTTIGGSVFANKTFITALTCPTGLKSVGSSAFLNCQGLNGDLSLDTIETIGDSAFEGCNIETLRIGSTLKSIGQKAFRGCNLLRRVEIDGNGNCNLGGYYGAFGVCPALETFLIGDGISSLGRYLFEGSYNLREVSFGSGIKSIPEDLLSNRLSLSKVAFASITSIGGNAFAGCTNLSEVSSIAEIKNFGNSAFYNCTSLPFKEVEFTNVETIGDSAFEGCNIETLRIGSTLKSIGQKAFRGCNLLRRVEIDGNGNCNLGGYYGAFGVCPALETFLIGDGISSLGRYLFEGSYNLREVSFGSGIKSIPEDLLSNRLSLSKVAFASITSIGGNAFAGCTSLSEISSIAEIKSFGNSAFSNCTSLPFKEVEFTNVETIGNSAFEGCKFTSIKIAPTLRSLGQKAFRDCKFLKHVEIDGYGSCSIGSYWGAFGCCTALEMVKIGSGISSLTGYPFEGCSVLSKVIFEGSPPSASSTSFSGVKSGAVGTYTAAHAAEWEAVIDSKGYWNGLKMKPSYYTVIYDANNGTGARTTATVEWGEPTPAGDGTFTWEAHYFMGWAFEDVGGGTLGSDDVIPEPQEGNTLTLYAVWVANKPILTNDNYSVIDGSLQLNWENPEAPMPPNMTYEVRRGFTDNYEAAEILTNGYDKLSYVDTQFDSIGSTSRIWYWVKPENNLFEVSEPCVTKNRYFLSVGFSTYGPGIKDKGITKDDAELAAGVAADMGGFLSVRGTSDGMCITDKYGTLANLNAAIDVCANRVKPGDIFFCYLATHGSMGTEDIEPQLLLYQGQRLMYSRLAKWCEDITKEQARFICVIMSCHSEALMNGGKIPTNETVLDNLETCGLRKCGAYSDLSAWVTSCSAEELSWKLSASAFSRFTMAFCGNGWVKGYADVDLYLEDTCEWIPSHGDGRLTLREIAEYSKKMYIGGAKESNVKINNADLLSRIDVGASTKDNNVKALPVPKNVKIKGVDGIISGDKQIVSWDAVPDADEYRIYRQYGSDEPVLACVVQWQTTSYEDYTRWSWLSTNYKYYIQAVNASAISVKSDKVAHLSVKRGTTQLTESDVRGYFAENGVTLADDLSDEDWRNIHDSDLDGDGVIAGIESISGVSPIDSSAQFSANITFENGQPKVTPVPDLGKKRQYTIYGKESLNDPNVDWVDVTDKDLSNYHFFKVTVDMP